MAEKPDWYVGDGWYFACPRCKRISIGGWSEIQKEVLRVDYEIQDDGSGDFGLEPVDGMSLDIELLKIRHNCGFVLEGYQLEDMVIRIEGDTIVDIGGYWVEHREELKELAEKNGLKVGV